MFYEDRSISGNMGFVWLTQFGRVGWNSYLSLLNQKKSEKPEVSEKVEELLA